MHRSYSIAVVLAVLASSILGGSEVRAGGGSGWGWAKPMNKRMGAFYTSNRNANFSRSSQSRHVSTPYHKPYQQTYQQPVQPVVTHRYLAPVVAPGVASKVVVTQPAGTHAPVVISRPTSVVNPVAGKPIVSPKPIFSTPPSKTQHDALPYQSKANAFWQ